MWHPSIFWYAIHITDEQLVASQLQDRTHQAELRFEIWILEETVRDRRELVANPRTPRDATAQFSSIASLGLRRALEVIETVWPMIQI